MSVSINIFNYTCQVDYLVRLIIDLLNLAHTITVKPLRQEMTLQIACNNILLLTV